MGSWDISTGYLLWHIYLGVKMLDIWSSQIRPNQAMNGQAEKRPELILQKIAKNSLLEIEDECHKKESSHYVFFSVSPTFLAIEIRPAKAFFPTPF